MVRRLGWLLALLALLPTTADVSAQAPLRLASPAPSETDVFGQTVAILGGDVLVGAPGAKTVYLYDGTTGALLRTFPSPSPAFGSFGNALAVVGPNVLVGNSLDNTVPFEAGSAHLIDGGTGAVLTSFTDPTPADAEFFGEAVATVGADVLVGAPRDGTAGPAAGAAYRFTTGGTLLQTFPNPTGTDTGFGHAVAGLGSDVLVGAPRDDTGATNAGAVYLFDGTTGALLRTFLDPTPVPNAGLGYAVAAVGGNVLVGGRLNGATPNVRVLLFDGGTGALVRTFLSPDTCTNPSHFGVSFAVLGTNVLIGQPFGGPGCDGAAYLFDSVTGNLLRTLPNPSPHTVFFGDTVAAAGGALVVGEPSAGSSLVEEFGAAWVFCGGAAGCGPCETCGPLGSCVVSPNPTCPDRVGPVNPQLQVKDVADDRADTFVFGAGRWPLAPSSGLRDPRQVVTSLCLYDESGVTPSLLFRAQVPVESDCGGTPCWTTSAQFIPDVFTYRDRERTPEGVERMLFRNQSREHELKLKVRGRGTNLSGRPFGLPTVPLPLPLRMQLQQTDGRCWQATYSTAGVRRNTPPRFSATSD